MVWPVFLPRILHFCERKGWLRSPELHFGLYVVVVVDGFVVVGLPAVAFIGGQRDH